MRIRRILTIGVLGGAAFMGYKAARRRLEPKNPEMAEMYGRYLSGQHRQVLVLGAGIGHVTRMAGGTLAMMTRSGSQIQVVTLSDDVKDRVDADLPPATHLSYQSDEVPGNSQVLEDLRSIWRRVNPSLVLAPDPTHPLPLMSGPVALATGRAALTLKRSLADGTDLVFYSTNLPNAVVHTGDERPESMRVIDLETRRGGLLGRWAVGLWARIGAANMGACESFRFLELPEITPVRESESITGAPRP